MVKTITDNQLLGELGETAVKQRFLSIGFQFDQRGRLEAGIDGIAEIMIDGVPTGKMIAVQVKSRKKNDYANEDDNGFTYLLKERDMEYWRPSNLPVIVIFYRDSDNTFFWKEVRKTNSPENRKLTVDKATDVFDKSAIDKLAALTVDKNAFGHFVPPLRGGETAIANMLPIDFPAEIYTAATDLTPRAATAKMAIVDSDRRFDWVIKDGTLWSFTNPLASSIGSLVHEDQVDVVDSAMLANHDDNDQVNLFAFLLKQATRHQFDDDLRWLNEEKIFYFKALIENCPRTIRYRSFQNITSTEVVNVSLDKKEPGQISFVRHHAFKPRFERLGDCWYMMISPTYFFTTNGFRPHNYPGALLAGKKRLDNNASLRGQVFMWSKFLERGFVEPIDLLSEPTKEKTKLLVFGAPPVLTIPSSVPEDVWSSSTDIKASNESLGGLFG